MHPEAVRDAVGPRGEVGRGLPGHQSDVHQVGAAGDPDLAEDRDDDPASVGRGEPGDGHDGVRAPPVEPPPPPAPGRIRHQPGEPGRAGDPQHQQPGDGGQRYHAGPVPAQPGDHHQPRGHGSHRMPDREPDDPCGQAGRAGPARSRTLASGRPAGRARPPGRRHRHPERSCHARPGRASRSRPFRPDGWCSVSADHGFPMRLVVPGGSPTGGSAG